jgi:hypothetical protein
VVKGDAELKRYITSYYKGLFGPAPTSKITLDESLVHDIPQVSAEESSYLTFEFIEDEIRKAIFQMQHNKASDPDSFLAEFFQAFWDLIKTKLMALFGEFHAGNLPLYSLNFGTIILLPKCKYALTIQQYRPICLLNVSFKTFTKVLTNRLSDIANKLIGPTQTAFILGQNIMEG